LLVKQRSSKQKKAVQQQTYTNQPSGLWHNTSLQQRSSKHTPACLNAAANAYQLAGK
jgi:hypothetical protein